MAQVADLKALTSIVAIDRNGAIGTRNSLPWRLKSDLDFFKQTTSKNTVVMGRKTYDSIGHCLPNRKNIILSHNLDLFESSDSCRLVHSVQEALHQSKINETDEVFVVGGAETYLQFAPYVDRYLVTVVDCEAPDADAYLARSILQDFARWAQSERDQFPAVIGQDDFPFTVYEIRPDDVEHRRNRRENLIREYADQIKSSPAKSSRRKSDRNFQQLSFI